MEIQQFAPPPSLRTYVRYFWAMEHTAGSTAFRTLPDGCPGLLFQQNEAGLLVPEGGKAWPLLLLHGQTTRPLEVRASAPCRVVGLCLQPGALAAVFGVEAGELTDSCLDPALLPAPAAPPLLEQLAGTGTVAAQLAVLGRYVQAMVAHNRVVPVPGIEWAVQRLVGTGGGACLRSIQAELQVSERSFQRRFKQSVGVPPKLFARICQFQESMAQLRRAEYEKLSDIAYAHDYADQSHYIRAFREFAGSTPRQFRQQAHKQSDSLAELRG